jgi:glycerol-3-phosphate dehydrogenase
MKVATTPEWAVARKLSFRWEESAAEAIQRSQANLGPQFAKALAWWHGGSAPQIIDIASEQSSFRQPLCSHSSHIVAEAIHAVRHELAVTLGDILLRRVPVALAGSWSSECTRTASQRIGRGLGWSESEIETAREAFEAERDAFLIKPRAIKAS